MTDPEAVTLVDIVAAFDDLGGCSCLDCDLEMCVPSKVRRLAAAGYTVVKGRYEPVGERIVGTGWEPLYRKIEGSTDGADRD